MLIAAARRLPRGRAVGVDVWRTREQSGNSIDITRRNAELEGVADRVALQTADIRDLPFEKQLGLTEVKMRELGPRMWYGNPFLRTRLVSGVKPH